MTLFWQGFMLGLAIAAPVGPIGVLCIRRSLSEGRWIGFATGLGAATADAAYGAVAVFGLTAVSSLLVAQRFWLGLVGGLFLCFLGVRTFLSQPAPPAVATGGGRAAAAYGSTLLLTLTNPMTILSFAAVFVGFRLNSASDFARASLLIAGVFLGSAAWWLLLSTAAGMLRARVTPAWMRAVNRISGVVIAGFGVWALAGVVSQ